MCGILGWQKRNKDFNDQEIILFKEALQLLDSRGPDNTGFSMNSNTLMGHKRLKILDISDKSNQPYSRVKGKTLVYNGEVYNYKELSKRLFRDQNLIRTEAISDTQVIYEILLNHEINAVNLFDGMFAFGWHDDFNNSILIARDCLGQKPLYYYHDENETIYSSELSAITFLKKDVKLSDKKFAQFLKNGFYPGENTPFERIHKLLPGYFLLLKDGYLNKVKYWQNKPSQKIQKVKNLSEDKVIDLFLDNLIESCQTTCKADVPVGIFLSGGIDSSLLYAVYKYLGIDIQSFTAGFEDREYDESNYAKNLVSDSSTYNKLIVKAIDVKEAMDYIYQNIDEPHGDPGLINAFLLTKFARQKVKVGLTGDGADELFGGYATFHAHALSRRMGLIPRPLFKIIRNIINNINDGDGYMNFSFKLKRFLNGNDKKGMLKYLNWIGCENNLLLSKLFSNKEICSYFLSDNLDLDVLRNSDISQTDFYRDEYNSLLNFYQKIFLPGFVCHHTDRASMLNSFEVRSPFLNKNLVKFANSLNKDYKYKNSSTKYLLRKALERLLGTNEIVKRKKMGFTMPLARWQRTDFVNELNCLPEAITNSTEGIIKHEEIERLVKDHMSGKKNHYQLLHSLLIFSKWREKNCGFKFAC